ncbi:MAG: imidazolonepropionase, partial [Pseudomonadota bacterium]
MTRLLLENLTLADMTAEAPTPYGLREDAAIAVEGERIAWVGARCDAPGHIDAERRDMGGRLVTPALIDCHTHLVFGGNRAREFEMRLNGASYEEVARAGGGIISTMEATRAASEDDLVAAADHLRGRGQPP